MPIDAQPIATFGSLEGIIPVGASTFTLTFGPYTDALGVNLSGTFSGKLYPVDQVTGKRTKVVHVSSGQVILPQDVPITVTGGVASVGPLPHTGQASMTPFFYRVEWALTSGKPSPGNKTFAAPAASGTTIDYDLLDTSTTPDVWVSPTVASVNGKTGAVVLNPSDVGAQPAGSYATPTDVATASTADRARANHTGTQPASTVTGLATVATSGSYTDLSAKPTIPTVGAAGAGATVALSSTDASVTNARTPSAHAASHASGGSDPVTPAAIGADAAGAATSAQAFAIQRANHTGTQSATTITGLATVATSGLKADVGLGNVDNTSDANKPVSTAQQAAITAGDSALDTRLIAAEATLTAASSTSGASTLVRRTGGGSASFANVDGSAAPTAAQHLTRKDYVDTADAALTSIAAIPPRIGKLAVVAGVGYMATGTTSTADWKQIT